MYYDDGNIFIEDDDQCITCENLQKGIACPLVQAISQGVVYLEDSLNVVNCGFYKKFERHLRLVIPVNNSDN